MADVVGYSRLMGEDETGALRRLKTFRAEIVDPVLSRHGGRLVDAAGDSLLIEFSSVVDAVEAAIALQQGFTRANAPLPPDKRLEYRIGVNIGDVIVQERALYGDGVNVAARLQSAGRSGGPLPLARSGRTGAGQDRGRLRRPWPADRQEHRQTDRRVCAVVGGDRVIARGGGLGAARTAALAQVGGDRRRGDCAGRRGWRIFLPSRP